MAQVIIKVPPQMFRTGAKHVEAAEESSSTEFERFEKLAEGLMKVPKSEVDGKRKKSAKKG